jgi:hypothetical protein
MLADFIERPAGEVLIGLVLVLIGASFYVLRITKSEDMIVAGLTLVGRAMVAGRDHGPTDSSTQRGDGSISASH